MTLRIDRLRDTRALTERNGRTGFRNAAETALVPGSNPQVGELADLTPLAGTDTCSPIAPAPSAYGTPVSDITGQADQSAGAVRQTSTLKGKIFSAFPGNNTFERRDGLCA